MMVERWEREQEIRKLRFLATLVAAGMVLLGMLLMVTTVVRCITCGIDGWWLMIYILPTGVFFAITGVFAWVLRKLTLI